MRLFHCHSEVREVRRRWVKIVDLIDITSGMYNTGSNAQTALCTFGWMVETANDRRYYHRGRSGPLDLLAGHPTTIGHTISDTGVFGREWRYHLMRRLNAAVLNHYASDSARQWRNDQKLTLDNDRISVPVGVLAWDDGDRPGWDVPITAELDALFGFAGRTLRDIHNPCHPDAREVQSLQLHILGVRSWRVRLEYGIPDDSSYWDLWFPCNGQMTFFGFLRQAYHEIINLLEPAPT